MSTLERGSGIHIILGLMSGVRSTCAGTYSKMKRRAIRKGMESIAQGFRSKEHNHNTNTKQDVINNFAKNHIKNNITATLGVKNVSAR